MQGDLTALIERVEKATGPSFELDVRIGCWRINFPVPTGEHVHWGMLCQSVGAQPVTSSLDAALALVEEKLPGWTWTRAIDGQIALWRPAVASPEARQPKLATEALTLIGALLRALQSQQKNSEVKDAG